MSGIVFNIQRFSLFDGPGVRTVVFLKGCHLKCLWCHNPEGLSFAPQVIYDEKRCIGCGECLAACGDKCHQVSNSIHTFERENCIACGKCADACPTGALAMAGAVMSADEVMGEVMKDESFYKESGGGLTLSGGEPLLQADFAIELLKSAKEKGISTCVETCGNVSSHVIRKAAEYTDIFYYDYKATGGDMHRKLCGVGTELIFDNLELLCKLSSKVTLRCPIVPGANETDEHILGIGKVAKRYTCIEEIHLEPYHKMGVSKAKKLGLCDVFDAEAPARERLLEYCKTISNISGKKCLIS